MNAPARKPPGFAGTKYEDAFATALSLVPVLRGSESPLSRDQFPPSAWLAAYRDGLKQPIRLDDPP